MTAVPLIWVVWSASFLVFIGFRVYVSRLSRNEDDQIVLQDSSSNILAEQKAIAARLQSARPVGLAILGLFGAVTLFVLGYYVLDMIRQFQ
ncbi:MAG: hypothetical protein WCF17_01535 [Terracidiphilus sp.]